MADRTYPQAYPFETDEIKEFLDRPLIAKLCTHNEDGTIHIVPIWYRYVDGEILLGTQEVTRKVRNIKRDNRVTLLVDAQEPVLGAVVFKGTAELDYQDVITKRISIFERYMSAERAENLAHRLAKSWRPVIVHIKPESMISFDYNKGFG
jgi:PPOX class probable F420-dependent enzyme